MVVKKFETRGGSRSKKRNLSGNSLLLDAIWTSLGGPTETAKKLKIPRQNLINWRNAGKVPLSMVGIVSERLAISPVGLNFIQYQQLFQSEYTWGEAVMFYDIPVETVKKIMAARPPKA